MPSATAVAHDATWGLTHTGRLAYLEERLGVTAYRPTPKQRVMRAVFYVLLTWGVPCALSLLPSSGRLLMPFALDIETHVRGLVAVPLLLLAEWPIEQRLRIVMRRLGSPPLMREAQKSALGDRIRWARRVAGHPLAEGLLLALAFAVGYRWLGEHELGRATWISMPRDGVDTVTAAGMWEAAVAVPAYSFLLARWLWRWVVLALLFWRVSRMRLRLVPNHGDRAAGLCFVSEAPVVFSWVIMATSFVACAKWMDAIIFAGMAPRLLLLPIQTVALAGVVWAFLPLFAFAPRLVVVRRTALRRYSDIVARHGIAVERRWQSPEDRVTSEDAESMANLNAVRDTVQAMRVLPIELRPVIVVVAAAIVPLIPVLVQIMPAREIAATLLQAFV